MIETCNILDKNVNKSLKSIPAIYIFKNIENGKYYVGETINLKNRISSYKFPRKKENRPIVNALAKYQWNKFTFEYYYLPDFNKNDLLDLEEQLIIKYNSIYPKGYNICPRGQDCRGVKFSKETRDKMSSSRSIEIHQYEPLTGKYIQSFKSAEKAGLEIGGNAPNISCVCNGSRKTAHGYIWSFEKRDNVTPVENVGVTHSKKIYKYTLDGEYIREYSSVTEAAKAVGGKASNLCVVCSGKMKSSHGYIWSYEKNDEISTAFKRIHQYDLDGVFIKTYDTLTEASNSVGGKLAAISNVCSGRNKTSYGYRWSYNKVENLRELNLSD
jgi:group I intron endonuclease